jgi:hypothetical protein
MTLTTCPSEAILSGGMGRREPDLGQGSCSVLADGITLARCLSEAILLGRGTGEDKIEARFHEYVGIRRWRSTEVIAQKKT